MSQQRMTKTKINFREKLLAQNWFSWSKQAIKPDNIIMKHHKVLLTAQESSSLSLSMQGRADLVELEEETPEESFFWFWFDSSAPPLLPSATQFFFSFFFFPLPVHHQHHIKKNQKHVKANHQENRHNSKQDTDPLWENLQHQDQEQLQGLLVVVDSSELCAS